MPWKEVSVMSQRLEFVQMASGEQANIRQLCRHFNISAPTAYKWLHRFKETGRPQSLLDQSRRPHHSPGRTADEIERLVVELRVAHPAWGGRKIRARLLVGLAACPGTSTLPTQAALRDVFRRYGLPARITMDNGSPWGCSLKPGAHTLFTIWLLRLGIAVSHSRPHHPQTQGKDERFHRTLQAELLRYVSLQSLAHCQFEFDRWRDLYNCQRPHEALGMQVPASRYLPSCRPFPETLPPVEYDAADIVRKVRGWGHIKYHSKEYFIGQAFSGLHVALRHTAYEGVFDVYFSQHRVTQIDVTATTNTH